MILFLPHCNLKKIRIGIVVSCMCSPSLSTNLLQVELCCPDDGFFHVDCAFAVDVSILLHTACGAVRLRFSIFLAFQILSAIHIPVCKKQEQNL